MRTPEEREKDWWQRWREEDYSWDGLADKRPIFGGPTLQEYWADEEDRLIPDPSDPEGRRYTRFHLPLTWADGTPTEKVSWSEDDHWGLAKELELRLQDALDTNSMAHFSGVVLLNAPKMPLPKSKQDDSNQPMGVQVQFNNAWLKHGAIWAGQVLSHAAFSDVNFSGGALFDNVKFSGYVGFSLATFSGDAGFNSATFSGDAKFVGATFSGDADLNQRLAFQDAVAKSGFRFFPAAFPSDPRFASGAFHGMVFEEIAYFGGAFHQFAAFEGADPRKDIRFSKFGNTPSPVGRIGVLSSLVSATQNVEQDKDEELKNLIGGTQILQIVSDRYRRREDERWFHRLELLAKEQLSTTSWFERFLTKAYAWTSDFGSSIGRPLLSMVIVTLTCSALYWTKSFNLGTNCPRLVHETCEWENAGAQVMPALTFAANSAFRPAYAISREERIANDFEKRILFGKGWKGALRAAFLGTLSTLQSFFSIIMLFLTGLAARRRFQLS
ncbi:MAG: pentapeptide repeat-containing protein [Pseudomonadota bacterium]